MGDQLKGPEVTSVKDNLVPETTHWLDLLNSLSQCCVSTPFRSEHLRRPK